MRQIEIKKYLDRIGIQEILEPSIKFLKQLQAAHLLNIPFENLDIHYGNKIELDISKLYEKIVTNGRGGFCYELNGLFCELLISLGFKVKRISANVYNKERGYGKDFDHLALLVNFEKDEYLADVGFGEFTMEPLKFELITKQKDKNGIFFFDKYEENFFRVNKLEHNIIIPQYIFKTTNRKLDDFRDRCNFHQTSKESHFTQKKIISLPNKDGRITLSSDKVKFRSADNLEDIPVSDENEFNQYLYKYFQIKKLK